MINGISKILRLSLTSGHDHVLSHLSKTNPWPRGHQRDARTHGIPNPEEYLWSVEALVIDIGLLEDDYGSDSISITKYAKKIAKGSLPPAIIILVDHEGRIQVADGGHRVAASRQAGLDQIEAFIGVDKDYAAHQED